MSTASPKVGRTVGIGSPTGTAVVKVVCPSYWPVRSFPWSGCPIGQQPVAWKTAAEQILAWRRAKQYSAIVNWVLSPATGYQYYPMPAAPPSPGPPDVWDTQRQVVGENATVVLMVLPYGRAALSGSFKGGGTRLTIVGQPARHGTINEIVPPGAPASPPGMGTAWFRSPLGITVIGENQAVTDKILAAILAALPSN
jgi:hypothetical protein